MKIAYTVGDPAGIGLEIYKKSLDAAARLGIELILVDDLEALEKFKTTKPGPSAPAGEHAYQTLKRAHTLALSGEVKAIITGPVAKGSLNMAGYNYSGQTEVLAALNNLKNSDIEMIFIYRDFRTLLATRHIAIKDVPDAFIARFASALENGIKAMQDLFAITAPRIAVAGLNPHAGEGGLFGDEETKLESVLNTLREKYPQAHISDFMSADSLFAKAAQSLRAQPPSLRA